MQKLLNQKQVCEILGCGYAVLRTLVKQHKIPFIRLGSRQIRFHPDALDRWFFENLEGQTNGNAKISQVEGLALSDLDSRQEMEPINRGNGQDQSLNQSSSVRSRGKTSESKAVKHAIKS